ncbi:MAG: LysM peptidoglycan-binding domain-containing protein [Flavobacterium sp.]|nr:MAG: LysM peptidoglycan-binding domain-containing protein [Flavobacterium sp.]
MIKKIFLLVLAMIALSCSSSKPVARNGTYRKPSTAVARNVKKPVTRKPVASRSGARKPQTSSTSEIRREYEQAKEAGKSTSSETVYSKSEILAATTRVKVTTAMVYDYIDQFKDIAKSNMLRYGIPASITLGQGILESGAGTGPLSALANNHFGIKCHKEWTGPSVSYDDDEEQECFRKYAQASESYQDHSLFLTSRNRYADLFTLDKDDYKAWAKGLKSAGYATDPKYPEKLIGLIERYQLYKYDSEVLGRDYVPVNVPENKAVASVEDETYQVTQGDTLYSISKRFNLSVDELRRKNNITDNAISIGQNLKVK